MMRRTSITAMAGLLALVAGCHGGGYVFAPAGPASRSLAYLGTRVLLLFGAVSTVMVVLIVVGAVKRRGTLEEHEPLDAGGGHAWLLVGGFLIPAAVMGALFIATLTEVDRFPLHDGGHYRPDIVVVGRQWWWEVTYAGASPDSRVTTANEIHVPVDWPVEIELESRDVIHSFWVPALHGKVDLVPGHANRIRIEADTPGRFDGMCAEYCGAEHAQMRFVVVAQPLDQYEQWLAHEGSSAVVPTDPEGVAGARLFQTKACGLCHAVRGTESMASFGPDLTHVASRDGLAAYSLPNTRAWLEAWITHAQSLKPGAQMPDLTELSGEEAQALAHYLEELK